MALGPRGEGRWAPAPQERERGVGLQQAEGQSLAARFRPRARPLGWAPPWGSAPLPPEGPREPTSAPPPHPARKPLFPDTMDLGAKWVLPSC